MVHTVTCIYRAAPRALTKRCGKPQPPGAGESANGEFPDLAVSTMAAIVANAEVGVDYYSQHSFIRCVGVCVWVVPVWSKGVGSAQQHYVMPDETACLHVRPTL